MSDAALDGVPSLGGSPVIFIAVIAAIACVVVVAAVLICLYCRRRRRRKAALARASLGNNLNTLHPGPSLGGRRGRAQGSGFAPVSQMNDDEAFNAAPSPRHSLQYDGAYDPYNSANSTALRTGGAPYSNPYGVGAAVGGKYDESSEVLATPTSTNNAPFSGRPGGAAGGSAGVGSAAGANAYNKPNRAQQSSAAGPGRMYSGHQPTASYGSGFSDASYSAPPRREERSSYYGGVGAMEPASDYLPPAQGAHNSYTASMPPTSSTHNQAQSWTAYASDAPAPEDAPPSHDFGAAGYAAEKQAHMAAHTSSANSSNTQSLPNPYSSERGARPSASTGHPAATHASASISASYPPPQTSSATEPPSYDALSIDERSGYTAAQPESSSRPHSEVMAAGPSRVDRASGSFPSSSANGGQNKWTSGDFKDGGAA
ncbi:hypothetical protein CBOM_06840 [Ceraceosorus bombacis]|uniref:Uncharacterized protein n=1 Tax=Ceraceosorus bombacis TaxID=401625 RepID=A0A0P1BSW3_9BASI|nr:hypothetical protein CBOM_06840 [Ceraceosorus bombacis]